jgi:hypothetical protein
VPGLLDLLLGGIARQPGPPDGMTLYPVDRGRARGVDPQAFSANPLDRGQARNVDPALLVQLLGQAQGATQLPEIEVRNSAVPLPPERPAGPGIGGFPNIGEAFAAASRAGMSPAQRQMFTASDIVGAPGFPGQQPPVNAASQPATPPVPPVRPQADPSQNVAMRTAAQPAAPAPQAPNGAAVMAGFAPHQSVQGSGGDLLSSLSNSGFADRLSDMLSGWAMGRNAQDSLSKGGLMLAYGGQERKAKGAKAAQKNATVNWLVAQGVGPNEAAYLASDPVALRAWHKEWKTGDKPEWKMDTIFNDQGREQRVMIDVKSGRWNPIGEAKAADPNSSLTSDMKEFDYARQQGFKGSFMDYQIKMKEAGRNQVNIDTGVKLPAGYRWKDPNNQTAGVEPIPGGPATQMPAELGARIGVADNFLGQVPQIREALKRGDVTGPIDRFMAGNSGQSPQADVFRKIQSGVDALQRFLTGAGMPMSEAAAYASRYLPGYTDDSESAVKKLDQLEAELKSARARATQGRGGAEPPGLGSGVTPSAPTVRRYNPATGTLD